MAAKSARPAGAVKPVAAKPAVRKRVDDDDADEAPAQRGFMQRIGATFGVFTKWPMLHVSVLCAVFAAVIAAGAYAAKDPHGLLEALLSGKGKGPGSGSAIVHAGRPELPLGASSTPDDDPVKHFAKTGIGQVVFSDRNTDQCRRTLFDNRTGGYREVPDVFCGQTPDQVTDAQSTERLDSMRKGFKK